MTAQENNQFKGQRELTDGPSREGLFDALRLCHEGRTVIFYDRSWRYIAKISMIESEDGSGENWNINGSTRIEPIGMPRGCGPEKPIHYYFIGHCRTDSPRKGLIKFV